VSNTVIFLVSFFKYKLFVLDGVSSYFALLDAGFLRLKANDYQCQSDLLSMFLEVLQLPCREC